MKAMNLVRYSLMELKLVSIPCILGTWYFFSGGGMPVDFFKIAEMSK